MAISAGIFVEILLVILFRRIKILQRLYFNDYRQIIFLLFSFHHVQNYRKQRYILIINPCPVLYARVAALPIHTGRIDRHEIILKQLLCTHH